MKIEVAIVVVVGHIILLDLIELLGHDGVDD